MMTDAVYLDFQWTLILLYDRERITLPQDEKKSPQVGQ